MNPQNRSVVLAPYMSSIASCGSITGKNTYFLSLCCFVEFLTLSGDYEGVKLLFMPRRDIDFLSDGNYYDSQRGRFARSCLGLESLFINGSLKFGIYAFRSSLFLALVPNLVCVRDPIKLFRFLLFDDLIQDANWSDGTSVLLLLLIFSLALFFIVKLSAVERKDLFSG